MATVMTHFALNCKDVDESLKFYEKTFGFKKVFELANPETGAPWIVYVQVAKGQFLELFYTDPDKKAINPTDVGFNHLCFQVDDIMATCKHIQEEGIEIDIMPNQGCDNNWQMWVVDPNGIRIEIMQIDAASPHYKYM